MSRPRVLLARIALAVLLLGTWATLAVARSLVNALREANLLRLSIAVLFAASAATAAAVIFRDPRNRSARALGAMAGVAGLYAAVVLPLSSPEEKAHFVQYGLVALLAWASMPVLWSEGRKYVGAALFTAAAGWIDEGIQALLPSRYYDLRDVAFNAAAGLMALGALFLVRRLRGSEPHVVSGRSGS